MQYQTKEYSLRLDDVACGRDNNIDLLKLLAAALVIVSHSFVLLYGSRNFSEEPLSVLTDGMLSLGGFAVGVFFLFGGYLIAKSCASSKRPGMFFYKRCRRIFPELIIVITLITFLFGPILSHSSLSEYLSAPTTYKYLLNILLIPTHSLPGVFLDNPYPNVVNGSLWTLPVEFICYILTYAAYHITKFDRKKYTLLCIPPLLGTIGYFLFFFPEYLSVVRAIILFWIGVTAYVFREEIPYRRSAYALAILAFIVLVIMGFPTLAMIIAFPPAMFFLAYSVKIRCCGKSVPELSYGIYLWGWPVGQAIVQAAQTIQVPLLVVLTLTLSTLLAILCNKITTGVISAFKQKIKGR